MCVCRWSVVIVCVASGLKQRPQSATTVVSPPGYCITASPRTDKNQTSASKLQRKSDRGSGQAGGIACATVSRALRGVIQPPAISACSFGPDLPRSEKRVEVCTEVNDSPGGSSPPPPLLPRPPLAALAALPLELYAGLNDAIGSLAAPDRRNDQTQGIHPPRRGGADTKEGVRAKHDQQTR